MEKLISVIVLNWNGANYLSDCLDSVVAQDYSPVEIIVVDNASADRSLELVRSKYRQVKLIENENNVGFSAGNNVGIREARGEYIVILNNDAELDSKCLSEMKRAIDEDPAYGACASKILLKFEEDLLDAAGIAICVDGISIGRGRLKRGDLYEKEEEVFFASGCCMMCRREMLEDVKIGDNYFDEDLFMYADDTDLGWRARLSGWKTIYAPAARAYHLHSASSESYSPLKAFLVERNRIFIQIKYFPLGVMLRGLVFTFLRYLFQAYGAFTGKGASGGFVRKQSKRTLVAILFRAWADVFRKMPRALSKRLIAKKNRRIGRRQVFEIIKKYGIGAKEIGLNG